MSAWQSQLQSYKIDAQSKAKVRSKFNFRHFRQAPDSKAPVGDIVGLEALDFSNFEENKVALAAQLEKAVTENGFFKITNFGLPQNILEEILSISQGTFDEPQEVRDKFVAGEHNLPEEKDRPLGPIRGSGYKPIGHWKWKNNTPDNIDIFNFRHFTHFKTFFERTEYPEFVKANLDDIAYYFNFIHREVLRRVATLLDIILELPEGSIYDKYFAVSPEKITESPDGIARFLIYHPVTDAYNEKTGKIWMNGHTDGGAFTFILSQPILSLQICDHHTHKWRYVSHTPASLVVNVADQFHQVTGGYFKSSVHRVITAPRDQQQYDRNTVIYFSNVNPQVYIDPDELQSPKLQRLGIKADPKVSRVTGAQWDDRKGNYFNKRTKDWNKPETILGRESVGTLVDGTEA